MKYELAGMLGCGLFLTTCLGSCASRVSVSNLADGNSPAAPLLSLEIKPWNFNQLLPSFALTPVANNTTEQQAPDEQQSPLGLQTPPVPNTPAARPRTNRSKIPATLQCERYHLALTQCAVALRDLEKSHDPEYDVQFLACLKKLKQDKEPDICKSEFVSPAQAAEIIAKTTHAEIPDFRVKRSRHANRN
jgi:hypothetical protein